MNIEVVSFTSQRTIFFPSSKKCCGPLFNIWKMGSRTPSLIVHLEPFAIFSHLLWPLQPAGGKIIFFLAATWGKNHDQQIEFPFAHLINLTLWRCPKLFLQHHYGGTWGRQTWLNQRAEICRKSKASFSLAQILETEFKVLTQVELPQYQKMLQNRQLPCNFGDYSLKWNAALLCCHLLHVRNTVWAKFSRKFWFCFTKKLKPVKRSPQLLFQWQLLSSFCQAACVDQTLEFIFHSFHVARSQKTEVSGHFFWKILPVSPRELAGHPPRPPSLPIWR